MTGAQWEETPQLAVDRLVGLMAGGGPVVLDAAQTIARPGGGIDAVVFAHHRDRLEHPDGDEVFVRLSGRSTSTAGCSLYRPHAEAPSKVNIVS